MFLVVRARGLALAVILLVFLVWLALGSGFETGEPVTTKPVAPITQYVEGYQDGPRVGARAAILMDAATGAVLYAKNEHSLKAPASTTKMMTAILALEMGDLNEKVSIGRRPPLVPGSNIELQRGQVLTLENLLRGLMMESGNDAATAIAEHLAGSESGFARLMNNRAHSLGAWSTTFANPHGLDPYDSIHLTSAFDLALIARRGLQIPKFREMVRTRSATISGDPGFQRLLRNTNRLLWYFGGADGVKTGTTSLAGNCLVASATRDGWQLIAVVLDSDDRWRDAAALLEHGFRSYAPMLVALKGEPVATTRVRWGMKREVPVAPTRDVALIVGTQHWGQVAGRAEVPDLQAPVTAGESAGRYRVYQDGHELTSVPLVTTTGTVRRTLLRVIGAGLAALWTFVAGGSGR